MTRRDWMLAGATATFLGSGLLCWTTATPTDWELALAGTVPVIWGMAAFIELARRSLR